MVMDSSTPYKSAWTALRDHIKNNLSANFSPDYKKDFVLVKRQYDAAIKTLNYPYIVLNPVEDKPEEVVNDHTARDHNFNCTIEVLSKDSETADLKGDLVQNLFVVQARRDELNAQNIINPEVISSELKPEIIEGEDIFVRYIVIAFESTL